MQAFVIVDNITGSVVNGAMRGLKNINVGFIQNITVQSSQATYHGNVVPPGPLNYAALNNRYLDMVVKKTATTAEVDKKRPWYTTPVLAEEINAPEQGAAADSPENTIFANGDANLGRDLSTSNFRLTFELFVAVGITPRQYAPKTLTGKDLTANNATVTTGIAERVYTVLGRANWEWQFTLNAAARNAPPQITSVSTGDPRFTQITDGRQPLVTVGGVYNIVANARPNP